MSLKVYGWTGYLQGVRVQVRAIVAASSWSEAARVSGASLSHIKRYGSMTGNENEVRIATAEPGTVFWQPVAPRKEWGGWDRYVRLGEAVAGLTEGTPPGPERVPEWAGRGRRE